MAQQQRRQRRSAGCATRARRRRPRDDGGRPPRNGRRPAGRRTWRIERCVSHDDGRQRRSRRPAARTPSRLARPTGPRAAAAGGRGGEVQREPVRMAAPLVWRCIVLGLSGGLTARLRKPPDGLERDAQQHDAERIGAEFPRDRRKAEAARAGRWSASRRPAGSRTGPAGRTGSSPPGVESGATRNRSAPGARKKRPNTKLRRTSKRCEQIAEQDLLEQGRPVEQQEGADAAERVGADEAEPVGQAGEDRPDALARRCRAEARAARRASGRSDRRNSHSPPKPSATKAARNRPEPEKLALADGGRPAWSGPCRTRPAGGAPRRRAP